MGGPERGGLGGPGEPLLPLYEKAIFCLKKI